MRAPSEACVAAEPPVRTVGDSIENSRMGHVDIVARILGAGGLLVAMAGIVVTITLWSRSGPRLAVKLSLDPQGQRLILEVSNVGRMPAVVRKLGIRDDIVVQGSASQSTTTLLSLEAEPADGSPLPRTVPPT